MQDIAAEILEEVYKGEQSQSEDSVKHCQAFFYK